MLRALATQGERYLGTGERRSLLGKKTGHWNSEVMVLRNYGESRPTDAACAQRIPFRK